MGYILQTARATVIVVKQWQSERA